MKRQLLITPVVALGLTAMLAACGSNDSAQPVSNASSSAGTSDTSAKRATTTTIADTDLSTLTCAELVTPATISSITKKSYKLTDESSGSELSVNCIYGGPKFELLNVTVNSGTRVDRFETLRSNAGVGANPAEPVTVKDVSGLGDKAFSESSITSDGWGNASAYVLKDDVLYKSVSGQVSAEQQIAILRTMVK